MVAIDGAVSLRDDRRDARRRRAQANEPPLVVLLDGITDPHNLGAIVRSAEVLGAHGVVIPARGSAPVTAGRRQGLGGRDRAGPHRRGQQPHAHHRLPARARACACWRRRGRRRAARPRGPGRPDRRWSSAPKGRGCARRWRAAATACSTSRSAATVSLAQRFGRRRHRPLRGGPPAAAARLTASRSSTFIQAVASISSSRRLI